MMRAMSRLILILVLPVFLASSVTMAVARHQPRVAGEIWLCSGTAMVSVSVDADGNPVGPMLPCPDCTLTLGGQDPGGTLLPAPVFQLLALRFVIPDSLSLPDDPWPGQHARGPPGTI